MKFIIRAKDLKRALSTCNEIAPASSQVAEERTGVLIKVREDRAVFMSSDDTSHTSVSVLVNVKDEGEALVKCSTVSSSVSATFADDDVDITLELTKKGMLRVSGFSNVKHNRNFPLLNADFFIETPKFEPSKSTEIKALDFQDGLLAVRYAASTDVNKLQFNCISTTFTDDAVVFAATDGVQIAEFRKTAHVPDKGLRGSFILGLKFANVVAKHVADILREGDGVDIVGVYIEGDHFFMKSGDTVLIGTLLNTDFPRYADHLDTKDKLLATFPTEAFLAVLSGMRPTVDSKSHRMVVDACSKGNATLSTSSVECPDAESSELEVTTSEDFLLHFDAVLLESSIRQLKGDTFEFYFTEDAAHIVLKSPKSDDFTALVCTLKPISY